MNPSLLLLGLFLASSYAGPSRLRSNPSWRVVGGTDAPEGLYPYQVSLQTEYRHFCGGTIIAKEWILTTVICTNSASPSSIEILAGTNKLVRGGERYNVIETHIHPHYNESIMLNDVALLKVQPITFNENVAPIILDRGDVAADIPVILTGWGFKKLSGDISNTLQHITLKTISHQDCDRHYRELGATIAETAICTLTMPGEGVCAGDTGGPLIKEDVNGERTLVGLVMWSMPCARGHPDVYSKVSSYIDWINSTCNCVN